MLYYGRFCGLDILQRQFVDQTKEPVDYMDAACKQHDEDYKKMGFRAYLLWNQADEKLLRILMNYNPETPYQAEIRDRLIFLLESKKKFFQHKFLPGLIPTIDDDNDLAINTTSSKSTETFKRRFREVDYVHHRRGLTNLYAIWEEVPISIKRYKYGGIIANFVEQRRQQWLQTHPYTDVDDETSLMEETKDGNVVPYGSSFAKHLLKSELIYLN